MGILIWKMLAPMVAERYFYFAGSHDGCPGRGKEIMGRLIWKTLAHSGRMVCLFGWIM